MSEQPRTGICPDCGKTFDKKQSKFQVRCESCDQKRVEHYSYLWHSPKVIPYTTNGKVDILVIREAPNGDWFFCETFYTEGENWEDFCFENRNFVAWAYTHPIFVQAIHDLQAAYRKENGITLDEAKKQIKEIFRG